jgi:hypothetical protein
MNTCREEDGVTLSETVSTEKRLLVVPQYTWKIEYHSHEY